MSGALQSLPGVRIETNTRLSAYTTFRLGGSCARLITCTSPDALAQVVRGLHAEGVSFTLIGGGSNILVSDEGVPGTVVRYAAGELHAKREGERVDVVASSPLDALASWCAEHGIEGLNNCTGIPGTVGGAIVGNAGAWGKQIADVLESVTLMDRGGEVRAVDPGQLGFAYRRSSLQGGDDVVVSARLCLVPGDREALLAERREILASRAEKHPDLATEPCIGSIFRNIEPTSAAGRRQAAGWFLEQAGAKEMSVGGARVFARHANIIVNTGDCSAQDVFDLAERMCRAVRDQLGLELVREVRYLGAFRGAAGSPVGFF